MSCRCGRPSALWAAGIGVIWPVARLMYALGYYKAAEKRSLGIYMSMPPIYIFVLGSIIGFSLKIAHVTH
jgi:glutathione S-transferase